MFLLILIIRTYRWNIIKQNFNFFIILCLFSFLSYFVLTFTKTTSHIHARLQNQYQKHLTKKLMKHYLTANNMIKHKRGKSNMCAGDFCENGWWPRRFRALSVSDVWKELSSTTTLATTHERRVHWNTAEISLRIVPIEVSPKISPRASLELETWNYHAPFTDASQVG